MLFPSRHANYFMNKLPYAVKFLSNIAGKTATNFVSIMVSNNNGDNFFWNTKILEGRDFRLNYDLGSSIRTILTKDATNTHYTGHDDFPTPWQIESLKEDSFVEITVRDGGCTTNHYIFSGVCLSLDVPSMTAQANGLVSRIISKVTSEVATYIYSTEDESSTTPILLGELTSSQKEL